MSGIGRLRRTSDGRVVVARVQWCESFGCKFCGLMFRRQIPADEGLLLVEPRPSRMGVSIHMFFMFFPIAAIWLDSAFVVVDCRLARPWRPFYAPRAPARYVLEADPALLGQITIGDTMIFEPLEG
jgi:uncharacterized membrane protein (UPF0127 family)